MAPRTDLRHLPLARPASRRRRTFPSRLRSPFSLISPLPEDDLRFSSMQHNAGVSTLEETQLVLLSDKCDIAPGDLLGRTIAVAMALRDGEKRCISGHAMARWHCAVQFGAHSHALTVTGPRRWRKRWLGWRLDEPQAVKQVRLDYALAFGGDPDLGRHKKSVPWPDNPVGVGWYRAGSLRADEDYAAPQFELLDRPYRHFDRPYFDRKCAALGFSPICRWWPARARHAGTYDERWFAQDGKWLADDFDTRFYNGAPEPLQVPYPRPGERLALMGLWPGREVVTAMTLPAGFPIAEFHRPGGFEFDVPMNLDTVLVDTDEEVVHLTWRLAVPQAGCTTACATSWPHLKREYFRSQGIAASPAHALVAAAQEAMAHG